MLVHEASVNDALASARDYFYTGELKEAERVCHEILQLNPAEPRALHRLAKVALAAGIPGFAVAFAKRTLALRPDVAAYHRTLGDSLRGMGKTEQAEASLRRAIELAPTDPRNHAILGSALIDQGRLTDALESIQRAIECAPDQGSTYVSLGFLYLLMGRAEDADATFRRASELDPGNPNLAAGVLFTQHYVPDVQPQKLFSDARAWGGRFADPLAMPGKLHQNDPDPNRRLRVGYMSGDFRHHPVGRVLQAVLPEHDPTQVEVFCYATTRSLGPHAKELADASDHWRSLVELGDEAAAERIRRDEIDILVDLSGHTAHNRLAALARKPAPVQAIWLGYFDTTGMASMDYIFADNVVCPPGDEAFYVENIVRLPGSFLCYKPIEPSPDPTALPMLSRGHVTFGSLNNLSKLSRPVIAAWADILHALPDARLMLKYSGLSDASVREDFVLRFGEHGIDPKRVSLAGSSPLGEHLTAYDQIDIALDPFPYNGGMTTLDALWMGAPVISLRGNRFVGRMSASALSNLGLDRLIAETPQEYVEKAVCLAKDTAELSSLRASLRERMLDSPICDGAAFARALEANYRLIWQAWCRSQIQQAA